jgi:hypothetical protein
MATRKHSKPINIRGIYIKFASEEQCLQYVEQMRWPDGIIRCPICGSDKVKRVRRPNLLESVRRQEVTPREDTCTLIVW